MKDKAKMKKRIIVGILVLVVIAAVSLLYTMLGEDDPQDELSKDLKDYIYAYDFEVFPGRTELIDVETDILAYQPYLDCNRIFTYKSDTVSLGYEMEEALTLGGATGMLARYIWSVINADYETHASLFSDDSYFRSSVPELFSKQMLYNVTVEYFGDYGDYSYFSVSYSIFENDFTYRLDVEENGYSTLWFEVEQVNGEYKIRTIYTSVYAISLIVEASST